MDCMISWFPTPKIIPGTPRDYPHNLTLPACGPLIPRPFWSSYPWIAVQHASLHLSVCCTWPESKPRDFLLTCILSAWCWQLGPGWAAYS